MVAPEDNGSRYRDRDRPEESSAQSSTLLGEGMEVDDGHHRPVNTRPRQSYADATTQPIGEAPEEDPSRSAKGKGKARDTTGESSTTHSTGARSEDLATVNERLLRAGIDPAMADFLDQGMAQVVIGQLLDTVENLRDSVQRANNARNALGVQLQQARKRPASPMDSGRQAGPARAPPSPPQAGPSQPRQSKTSARSFLATPDRPKLDISPFWFTDQRDSKKEAEFDNSGKRTKKGRVVLHTGLSRPEVEPNAFTPATSGGPAFHEPREAPASSDVRIPYIFRGLASPITYVIPRRLGGGRQHAGEVMASDETQPLPGVAPPTPAEQFIDEYVAEHMPPPRTAAQANVPVQATGVMPDDSESDDGASSMGEEEATDSDIEETPDQQQKRRGRNKDIRDKNTRKLRGWAQEAHIRDLENGGPSIEGLGTVLINNRRERNNNFGSLLDFNTYYSARGNRVFVGRSALDALLYERERSTAFTHPHTNQTYIAAPRGFPMIPRELSRLARLIDNKKASARERFEAWLLLGEFHRVASRLYVTLRDRTMMTVLTTNAWTQSRRNHPPISEDHPEWNVAAMPINTEEVLMSNPTNRTRGLGLPQPAEEQALDINVWAQYIAHHGRPGSDNVFAGIPIDYAYRVYLPAVFAYRLGLALAPVTQTGRAAFMRQWAMVLAQPGLYDEHIIYWNDQHPVTAFEELDMNAPHINIRRLVMDEANSHQISEAHVLDTMIENRIPRAWINHGYAYGFNYLNHYYSGASIHRELFERVDDSRINRLNRLGSYPRLIPEWDGWWTPSTHDRTRIHLLTQIDINERQRHPDQSHVWVTLGSPPVMRHLRGRPADVTTEVFPPPQPEAPLSSATITYPLVADQAVISNEIGSLSLETQPTPTSSSSTAPTREPDPTTSAQETTDVMDEAPDPTAGQPTSSAAPLAESSHSASTTTPSIEGVMDTNHD